jgi:hypothetical protein
MSSMFENMIRMGMLSNNKPQTSCLKQKQPLQPEPAPGQTQNPYVSTLLDIHFADTSLPEDITIDVKVYRQLTPDYFAWLRARMVSAQAAHKTGKLSNPAWETLRERFNSLQEMAIEEFGKEPLQQALREFNPKSYTPPLAPKAEPERSTQPPKKD